MKDQSSTSPCPENLPSRTPFSILLVEDSKADAFLMREAIEATGLSVDFHVVGDGETAINFLATNEAELCSLIILDLNLPKKSGIQVLRHMRQSDKFAKILVLIVSSSDSISDRSETARIGIDGYFRKPSTYDGYIKIGEAIKNLLLE